MKSFSKIGYTILGIGYVERIPNRLIVEISDTGTLNEDPGHEYGLEEVMSFFTSLLKKERVLFLKGFVLSEKHFNWPYTSVPTTPYLLDYIMKKDGHTKLYIESLYNWIFKNRGDNPHTPTRMSKHGKLECNSYEDMVRINELTAYNVSPNRDRIIARRERKSYIKQLNHMLRLLEKDQYQDKIREEIERFNFHSSSEKVQLIKKGNLNFPITLLPEKTIDLFIQRVSFRNESEKTNFLDSLPKRTNKKFTRRIKNGLSQQTSNKLL